MIEIVGLLMRNVLLVHTRQVDEVSDAAGKSSFLSSFTTRNNVQQQQGGIFYQNKGCWVIILLPRRSSASNQRISKIIENWPQSFTHRASGRPLLAGACWLLLVVGASKDVPYCTNADQGFME